MENPWSHWQVVLSLNLPVQQVSTGGARSEHARGDGATGQSCWVEWLLAELGIEVWIGDATETKTKGVRKRKTDHKDVRPLLKLLQENNFLKICVPSPENRELRQLLWHWHRLTQNAGADHESAVGSNDERRSATEEKAA